MWVGVISMLQPSQHPKRSPTLSGGGFFWIFIAEPLDTVNVLGYTWSGRVKYIKKLPFRSIVPHGESRVKVTLRVIM
jgi:hypothetical protein